MRNVFDQYTQPENRLTHALACALHEDAALLRAFVTWVGGVAPPDGELEIVEQSRPGVRADEDGDGSASSLPDAWITSREDERWALLIEAKVQAPVELAQLEQHRLTAGRHGAADPTLVLITARPSGVALPEDVIALRWCAVYAWFRDRRAHSAWARRFAEYVEIVEAKWIARDYLMEGNLTMFTGIESTAEAGYSPQRAKQQLRHAMEAIRAHPRCHDLGIDPRLSGRAKIPLSETEIWDYVKLAGTDEAELQTHRPHFTLGIRPEGMLAVMLLPNHWLSTGAGRSALRELTYPRFSELVAAASRQIVERLGSTPAARPWILVQQRRALTGQRLNVWDAQLEFDPQTAIGIQSSGAAGNVLKEQPQWLTAVYDALTNKTANLELCLGGRMTYDFPDAHTPAFIDRVLDAWEATIPLLRALHVVR